MLVFVLTHHFKVVSNSREFIHFFPVPRPTVQWVLDEVAMGVKKEARHYNEEQFDTYLAQTIEL